VGGTGPASGFDIGGVEFSDSAIKMLPAFYAGS
jgi:hypothetical protein